MVLAGFVGSFGSFWVVPCFSNYECHLKKMSCPLAWEKNMVNWRTIFSQEKVGNDEKQHRAEWSSTQYTRECNCTLHSYWNPRSTCSNVYKAVSWKMASWGRPRFRGRLLEALTADETKWWACSSLRDQ